MPSTDIGSGGPYGVYHSAFDNYNWFIKNADPTFVYEQQQARVFGLELLHMADADVLPYNFQPTATRSSATSPKLPRHGRPTKNTCTLDFAPSLKACRRIASPPPAPPSAPPVQLSPTSQPHRPQHRSCAPPKKPSSIPPACPNAPGIRHTVFAPGEFTGYAAVVIPGVTEGIDAADAPRTQSQLAAARRSPQPLRCHPRSRRKVITETGA